MKGFSTTLKQLCAGKASLEEVLAAYRREPAGDGDALRQHSVAIEAAWRAGTLERPVYEALRDAVRAKAAGASRRDDNSAEAAIFPSWSPQANEVPSDDEVRAERPSGGRGSTRLRPAGGRKTSAQTSSSAEHITSPSQPYDPSVAVGPGTVLKERFVLEEVIGRGGMGTIFRARDLRKEEAQDRDPYVAVKVLNEDFRKHPEALKALQRESRKAQALAHPNVATVFDFDRDGSLVFLVMELLEGVSLDKFIKSRVGRPLPQKEALRMIEALCAALSHAHQKDLVHADFKPANAFRTREGAVKVLDFGIARAIGRRTHEGDHTMFDPASLGALTPCYASPEMLVGDPPDPRDDVYALACVSYELFCSRHPFDFTSSLLAERRGMKPAPIPGLDRRIWRALVHGLAFARADRTTSVDAFLSEIVPDRKSGIGAAAAAVLAVIAIGALAWTVVPRIVSDRDNSSLETQVRSGDERLRAEVEAQQAPLPTIASAKPQVVLESRAIEPERLPEAVPQTAPEIVPEKDEPAAATVPPPAPTPKATAPDTSMSVARRKERLLALASAGDVPEALELYRDLKSQLPANDAFIAFDAPNALGQMYLQLSARAFETGEFEQSGTLLARAAEFSPDAPAIAARRESVERLARVAHTLDNVVNIAPGAVNAELEHVEMIEAARYPLIRAQLAELFARRITDLQPTAPARANDLLKVGKQIFAGTSAFDSLHPVEERSGALLLQTPVALRADGSTPTETAAATDKPE